jgi:hypothetical protein
MIITVTMAPPPFRFDINWFLWVPTQHEDRDAILERSDLYYSVAYFASHRPHESNVVVLAILGPPIYLAVSDELNQTRIEICTPSGMTAPKLVPVLYPSV